MSNPFRRWLARASVSCLLAVSGLALAQAEGPGMEKTATFRVLIDAAGKLKSAAPLDAALGADLNRAIIGAAKDVVFEPAMRDGQAADFESQLTLTVRFVAQATGGYKLELVSAALSPQPLERGMMVFPRGVDRKVGAVVAVQVAIGADGRVDTARSKVLRVAATTDSAKAAEEFGRATIEALGGYRFQPDLVGGKPVAMDILQTIRFCATDCSKPQEPDLSSERAALPRIAEPGVRGARVPAALKFQAGGSLAKPMRFRMAIDANGAVTGVQPIGEVDAALLASTRARLQAARFFPATIEGRPVASEMPVSVPVRVADGVAQAQLERLTFDVGLLQETMVSTRGLPDGELRARLHIVTGPDGRVDRAASGVESLELLPKGSVAQRRSVQDQLEKSLASVRVETVQVDGRNIPLEFYRWRIQSFCTSTGGHCTPPTSAPPPPDPGISLPAGIELARLKP
jgi:hypothetical protein